MADIFKSSQTNFGGAFSPDKGLLTEAGNFGAAAFATLLQNISVTHSRPQRRIYEIGTAGTTRNHYLVSGQADGMVAVGHILGLPNSVAAFYEKYSDPCKAATNEVTLGLAAGMCGTPKGGRENGINFKLKNIVLISIGISTDSESLLIQQNGQLMFTGLEYTTPAASAPRGQPRNRQQQNPEDLIRTIPFSVL